MSSEIQVQEKKPLEAGWQYSKDGETKKPQLLTAGAATQLLKESWADRLKFNCMSLEPELDGNTLPADYLDNFYVMLSQIGWQIGKTAAADALMFHARKNGFHPVVDYLNRIESDDSVKPVDINTIASTYLGTDKKLYDSMMAATLIAAVARPLDRGCKFDSCCTLKGKQGVGKSSFWRILASDNWFSDSWLDNTQNQYMNFQTCWFLEISELDHLTNKQDAGRIKALLSSSIDTFRSPYSRTIGRFARPSIMVATCNRSDFLTDPTGSRRFWIIDLPNQFIDLKKVADDRDSIFKAAILAYRSGRKPILTTSEQTESNQQNELFESENPFLARLIDWMNHPLFDLDYKDGFTTETALIRSGCREEKNLKNPDLKSAAECLRQLGFEKDKHQLREEGKKVARKWRKTPHVSQENKES